MTYEDSKFTSKSLKWWVDHGANTDNFIIKKLLESEREGLTLFFSTCMTSLDHFLVDYLISRVLGQDTDCHIIEFKEHEDIAIVRLMAENEEVKRIAEALYKRVWEREEWIHERVLIQVDGHAQPGNLAELHSKIEKLELWNREDDTQMLEAQAEPRIIGFNDEVEYDRLIKAAEWDLK